MLGRNVSGCYDPFLFAWLKKFVYLWDKQIQMNIKNTGAVFLGNTKINAEHIAGRDMHITINSSTKGTQKKSRKSFGDWLIALGPAFIGLFK